LFFCRIPCRICASAAFLFRQQFVSPLLDLQPRYAVQFGPISIAQYAALRFLQRRYFIPGSKFRHALFIGTSFVRFPGLNVIMATRRRPDQRFNRFPGRPRYLQVLVEEWVFPLAGLAWPFRICLSVIAGMDTLARSGPSPIYFPITRLLDGFAVAVVRS